jgi:SAM-dependent methyltransferase
MCDARNGTPGDAWRGTDLSGMTVVLGVGTGRLISLLTQQAAVSQGNVLVVNYNARQLQALTPVAGQGPLSLVCGRPRQIPVLTETVDLLVVNGALREVPTNRLDVMFEEMWRVLVPGGHARISDVIEPSEAADNQAWAVRNEVVRKLGGALSQPTALSVDLQRAAAAMRSVGFENLALSFLPGYTLTDDWLQETVNAIRTMAGRVVDREQRDRILKEDVTRLIECYSRGRQRAAERFVLRGTKTGDMALAMEASFTESDLLGPED